MFIEDSDQILSKDAIKDPDDIEKDDNHEAEEEDDDPVLNFKPHSSGSGHRSAVYDQDSKIGFNVSLLCRTNFLNRKCLKMLIVKFTQKRNH